MALHLIGETLPNSKRKLNPFKRVTRGDAVNVTVDGKPLEVMVDAAGKYSYLNVGGVDCYVSAKLEDGQAFTTEDIIPKPKKAKADEAEAAPAPKARGRRGTAA